MGFNRHYQGQLLYFLFFLVSFTSVYIVRFKESGEGETYLSPRSATHGGGGKFLECEMQQLSLLHCLEAPTTCTYNDQILKIKNNLLEAVDLTRTHGQRLHDRGSSLPN